MRLWRVSEWADISGRGGLFATGRWNRIGIAVVYCADHPATALLEKLVHIDFEDIPASYQLLSVEVPDDIGIPRIEASSLPANWRSEIGVSQALGTDLLMQGDHLFFWVPSALVPRAWNALVNPRHPDIVRCSVVEVVKHPFDRRFIR